MPEYTRKKPGGLTPYEKKLMASGPSRNITTNTDDDKKDFPTDRLPRGKKFAEEQKNLDKTRNWIRRTKNDSLQAEQDRKYVDKSLEKLGQSTDDYLERYDDQQAFKKGGMVKSSASRRGDGIASRGKTNCKMR